MFMERQKVTARCVRSRQTPFRLLSTSTAVVSGLLVPYWKWMLSCTQSQIACTRPARGRLPKQIPGHPHQLVRQAIPAGQREMQELAGQLLDRLLGHRRGVGIGLVRDRADRVVTKHQGPGRHDEALDRVPVDVTVLV